MPKARVHATAGVSALFIDDVPGGGCHVECGGCGLDFELNGTGDTPYYCKHCHQEVCYRPWYEW